MKVLRVIRRGLEIVCFPLAIVGLIGAIFEPGVTMVCGGCFGLIFLLQLFLNDFEWAVMAVVMSGGGLLVLFLALLFSETASEHYRFWFHVGTDIGIILGYPTVYFPALKNASEREEEEEQ